MGLVRTSAVLTAVLGLAAQDPLKDFIGGLSLQLEQVIREGDWVEIEWTHWPRPLDQLERHRAQQSLRVETDLSPYQF